jgi:hypothetical protein
VINVRLLLHNNDLLQIVSGSEIIFPEVKEVEKHVQAKDSNSEGEEKKVVFDFGDGGRLGVHCLDFVDDTNCIGKWDQGDADGGKQEKENHHKDNVLDLHEDFVDRDENGVLVSHEETNWKERDLDGVDGGESRKEGSIAFIIQHLVSGDKNLAEVKSVTSAVEDVVCVCQDGNDQVHDDDVEAKNDGDCVNYAENAQVTSFNFHVGIKGVVSERGVEDLQDRAYEVLKVSILGREVDVSHDGKHKRQKKVQ